MSARRCARKLGVKDKKYIRVERMDTMRDKTQKQKIEVVGTLRNNTDNF